jgi:putative transposase
MIHELRGSDIHEYMVQRLNTSMDLGMQGYRIKNELAWDILLKAGSEQRGLPSVSRELSDSVHHNTIRGHLNQRFDINEIWLQEREQNKGLAASLPPSLWDKAVEIAIDWHDEPSYSRDALVQTYTCRSKAKAGTTHFWRVASAYVMHKGQRFTVGLVYVLPEYSTLMVVQRLIERIHQHRVVIKRLYLDKGFCQTAIIQYLQDHNLSAIIACPIRGKQGGTRALCQGRCSYNTTYTFGDGTTVQLACVRTKPHGKNGKRRLKWLLFVCIGVTWSPKKVKQRYRRRFGIETSYRLSRRWRIQSTSANPALRFFLYGLTFWIVNLWSLFKWKFVRHPHTRKIDPTVLPLSHFAALLRRAIETFRGVHDSIPVFLNPVVLKL